MPEPTSYEQQSDGTFDPPLRRRANTPEPSTPPATGPHPPLDDQLCTDPDCGCCYPGGLEEAQPTGEEVIRYAALIGDVIPQGHRAVTQAVIGGMLQAGWERPAGPDPHPATPAGAGAGSGVLGRALLGHFGVPVLVEDEQGNWGSGFVRPVPRVEAVERFAAREVLLVSPAAGRVLELTRRAVAVWRDMGHALLAAAVDAAYGDQPAGKHPSTGPDNRTYPDSFGSLPSSDRGPGPAFGCLLTEDNDMEAFAALPDCPVCEGTGKDLPPDWRSRPAGTTLTVPDSPKMLRETLCVAQTGIASAVPVLSRRQHLDRLQRLIDECDRHRPLGPDGKHGDRHTATCGCAPAEPALEPDPQRNLAPEADVPTEPAVPLGPPEPDSGTDTPVGTDETSAQVAPQNGTDIQPDSGPGWDRAAVQDMADDLPPGARDQVLALLADRDRWAKVSGEWADETIAARNAADAARAELAEVTADRDGLSAEFDRLLHRNTELVAERDTARRQLAETVETNHQLAADVGGLTAEVKAALPGPDWTRPVGAEITEALATARRDGAADALADFAAGFRSMASDHPDAPNAEALATIADTLDHGATEVRAGTRPVGGSPEPAGDYERCPCGCNPNGEPTVHVTLPFPCSCGEQHGTYAEAFRAHDDDARELGDRMAYDDIGDSPEPASAEEGES